MCIVIVYAHMYRLRKCHLLGQDGNTDQEWNDCHAHLHCWWFTGWGNCSSQRLDFENCTIIKTDFLPVFICELCEIQLHVHLGNGCGLQWPWWGDLQPRTRAWVQLSCHYKACWGQFTLHKIINIYLSLNFHHNGQSSAMPNVSSILWKRYIYCLQCKKCYACC